jgi:cobalt-zinc-cadmium efflux system protein
MTSSAHDHTHGSELARAGQRHKPRLVAAFVLTLVFVVVQAAAAFSSSSLALLSDAGHMLTDVAGLGMALAAISLASRTNGRRHLTFGLYRLEVLAALANAFLLFGVAAFVTVEAIRRFGAPQTPNTTVMLVVACIGLGVNVVAMLLLRSGAQESINLRAAYLEVFGDVLGSVAVIVGAVAIAVTGWNWVDPVLGVAIAAFILPRAYRLGRAALRILVEGAPEGLDPVRAEADLLGIDGVVEVHDLHVWTLTSDMNVGTVHLVVTDAADAHAVLDESRRLLRDDYDVHHATVQVEPASHGECIEADW